MTTQKDAPDSPRFLGLDHHIIAFHSQFVNRYRGLPVRRSGLGLDFPTVPRTHDLTGIDKALPERTSTVGTDIVQSTVLAVYIGNADRFVVDGELTGFTRRR